MDYNSWLRMSGIESHVTLDILRYRYQVARGKNRRAVGRTIELRQDGWWEVPHWVATIKQERTSPWGYSRLFIETHLKDHWPKDFIKKEPTCYIPKERSVGGRSSLHEEYWCKTPSGVCPYIPMFVMSYKYLRMDSRSLKEEDILRWFEELSKKAIYEDPEEMNTEKDMINLVGERL